MNGFDLDPIIILFNILEILLHIFNILKTLTYLLTIFLVLMFSWAFVTLFRTCKLKKSLSNHTGGSSLLSEEDHLHASSDPGVVWIRSFVDKVITRSGLACFAPCLSCLGALNPVSNCSIRDCSAPSRSVLIQCFPGCVIKARVLQGSL